MTDEDPVIAAKTRAIMEEIAANTLTTVAQCPGLLAFGPIYRALDTLTRALAAQQAENARIKEAADVVYQSSALNAAALNDARETVKRLNRRCQLAEAAANIPAERWGQRSEHHGRGYLYAAGLEVVARQRECEERERAAESTLAAAVREARAETWEAATVPEQIARLAHRGQVDKAGRPYIEHVERVVARVKGDPDAEAVAWLHDVIEDTMFTVPMVSSFVDDPEILEAIEALTRDKAHDSYAQYIDRIVDGGHPLALKVKLADLRDHLDNPGCPDSLRPRYEAALIEIEGAASRAADPTGERE